MTSQKSHKWFQIVFLGCLNIGAISGLPLQRQNRSASARRFDDGMI